MLVLTRRIGETLVIGQEGLVTVAILGIKGNQVKVGINAPQDIPVHRLEIYQRIQDAKSPVKSLAEPRSAEASRDDLPS